MADGAVMAGERRRGKGIWPFLLGLILGLLLGGLSAYMAYRGNAANIANRAASSQSAGQEKKDGKGGSEDSREQKGLDARQRAAVDRYAAMLVEASREGVDAPSDEATAARNSLSRVSDEFLSTFKDAKFLKNSANTDDLKSTLEGVNDSFLQYAGTARQGDDHKQVDESVKRLSDYISQNAEFNNRAQFDAGLVSFKNTVLESVRNFVRNDFAGSYAKETQAQDELRKVLETLKQRQ